MPDVPLPNHYGSFMCKRKHDYHGGVDLYCLDGSPVYAVEDGVVILVRDYTGEKVGCPWWNETRAVYVEGDTGVICYGEIQEGEDIKSGVRVSAGHIIGQVKTVLKKDKGKPMSMLHFALHRHGFKWRVDNDVYEQHMDPTLLLIQCKINAANVN